MIKYWIKKWNQYIDVNKTLLNFNLLIGYTETKSEKILTDYIWDSLAINHNFCLAKTATKILVLIMPSSYKFNIVKTLEKTFYISYILIRRVKTVYKWE